MNKYQRTKALVDLLENQFSIGRFKIGLDPLLGLVPEIGDLIGTVLALYIVYQAKEMGLPNYKLARMVGNIAIDLVIGAIPLAGDLADFAFRANMRNWKIIEEHFSNIPHQPTAASPTLGEAYKD